MKKLIAGALLAIFLSGCDSASRFEPPVVPAGLKDCAFYEIYMNGARTIVVRCPNSQTSAALRSGKTAHYTTLSEE